MNKLKQAARKLKLNISALLIAYKRKDLPFYAKLAALAAVAYALSPIDLIPDFIPVLGYLDDLIILPILIFIALKVIPADIMEDCRIQAKEVKENGKTKNRKYAIPIIIIWLAIIFLIVKHIWF